MAFPFPRPSFLPRSITSSPSFFPFHTYFFFPFSSACPLISPPYYVVACSSLPLLLIPIFFLFDSYTLYLYGPFFLTLSSVSIPFSCPWPILPLCSFSFSCYISNFHYSSNSNSVMFIVYSSIPFSTLSSRYHYLRLVHIPVKLTPFSHKRHLQHRRYPSSAAP